MVFPDCRRHGFMKLRLALYFWAVVVSLGAGSRLHAQEGATVQARLAQDNLDAVRQAADQGDVALLHGSGRRWNSPFPKR